MNFRKLLYYLLYAYCICNLFPTLKCNTPLINIRLNKISLKNHEKEVAISFKDFLITNLDKFNISNDTNAFNICKDEVNLLSINNQTSLFKMFISTGINRDDFGDYEYCNKINNTKFALLEDYVQGSILDKIEFGLCIPFKCMEFIEMVQEDKDYFEVGGKYYRLILFPKTGNKLNEASEVWLYGLVIYTFLVIILNIIMWIFFKHYNPYDKKELHISQLQKSLSYRQEESLQKNKMYSYYSAYQNNLTIENDNKYLKKMSCF